MSSIDMREMLYAIRGVGDTLTCDRCGYTGHPDEFEPEEAGEWECRPCNTRLNEEERLRWDEANRP